MNCESKGCKNEATRLNVVLQDEDVNLVDPRTHNVCDDCFYGWGFFTIDEFADLYRRANAGEEVTCDAGHNEFVGCLHCGRTIRDVDINIVDGGYVVCKGCREREEREAEKADLEALLARSRRITACKCELCVAYRKHRATL